MKRKRSLTPPRRDQPLDWPALLPELRAESRRGMHLAQRFCLGLTCRTERALAPVLDRLADPRRTAHLRLWLRRRVLAQLAADGNLAMLQHLRRWFKHFGADCLVLHPAIEHGHAALARWIVQQRQTLFRHIPISYCCYGLIAQHDACYLIPDLWQEHAYRTTHHTLCTRERDWTLCLWRLLSDAALDHANPRLAHWLMDRGVWDAKAH